MAPADQASDDRSLSVPASDWIGRTDVVVDHVSVALVWKLQDVVALGGAGPLAGAPAPLGIHWCLATPAVGRADLQADGHPRPGATILPPVPLPRRMWAGGDITWHDALCIGDEVTRRSTVKDVTTKHGRSGALCFVQVEHQYVTPRGLAISELQDIVYRAAAPPGPAPTPALSQTAGSRLQTMQTDPVQLFRYSALTGNAHRIHYDLAYATGVEGYSGLVVHGPLQATLLMQAAAAAAGRNPARFSYRATAPLFCGDAVAVCCDAPGLPTAIWTSDAGGRVGLMAELQWS